MSRWVRVDVSVFEHEFFASSEPFSEREAWLWLIANAAWKNTTHRVGNVMLDVPVGSLFATLRGLQNAWHWASDKRVRSFIMRLENGRMVSTKTDAGKTHITICNYSLYQEGGRSEDASRTQVGRSEDAQKTPLHQHTKDISSLRSDICPEPEKSAPASPTVIELPATKNEIVPITEADVAEWIEAFPAVDVRQKLRAIRQWLIANPQKRKTSRGMKRFVVAWLGREQDRGGMNGGQGPPTESAFARHQREGTEALERRVYGDKRNDQFASDGPAFDLEPGDYRAH
jgi:hypothetical protein